MVVEWVCAKTFRIKERAKDIHVDKRVKKVAACMRDNLIFPQIRLKSIANLSLSQKYGERQRDAVRNPKNISARSRWQPSII